MRKSNARQEPAKDASGTLAAYISADERRAAGRLCVTRRRTPRTAVGSRPRIGAIRSSFCAESNEGRIRELIPLRFFPHGPIAFRLYRGAAAVMAADLAYRLRRTSFVTLRLSVRRALTHSGTLPTQRRSAGGSP